MFRLRAIGPLGRISVAMFLALSTGWPLLRAADIQWTLDGNGVWDDAANWSSNPALPGAGDGVTIDIGGNAQRVITHAKNADTIATLTNLESLRITGGSLSVTGAFKQAVGGDLFVNGGGSAFTALGSTALEGATLLAQQGGKIDLPATLSFTGPSTFNGRFEADGAGSLIDLGAVTSFAGGNGRAMQLYGTTGGKLDVSGIPQISAGATDVRANGLNSVVDLSSLTSWTHTGGDTSRLWAQGGGKVLSPNLASITDVEIRVDGAGSQLDLGKLTSVDRTRISAVNGGQIALPLVTSYTGPSAYNSLLEANGVGAALDLSKITAFAGGNGRNTQVFATSGGKIDLSKVPQISGGAVDLRANFGDAVIDLSSLTSWTHTGGDISRFWAQNSGKVLTPNLTSIVDVDIRVEGATSHLDLGKLTNVDRTNITAAAGGQIALPLVTSYTGPSIYNGLLAADGGGSLLDLTKITSFAGGNGRSAQVFATNGGKVDLSSVPQISGGATDVRANFAGSVVDLSALTSWTHTGGDTSRLWAQNGGKVLTPNLTSIVDVDVHVEGAGSHIDLGKLTDVSRAPMSAVNGGQIALPLVTSYTGPTQYNGHFEAFGGGSLIDLTAITAFAGGNGRSAQVFASFGGKVDLKNAPEFSGGAIDLRANGANSVIDLSALQAWTHTGGDTSRLWAQNGGKVLSPNLTSIVDVEIHVEGAGSQIDLGKVADVSRTNISVLNGGQLALPLVTSYTGPSVYNGLLESFGGGSLLDLKTITSFTGGDGRSARVFATNGGKVDFSKVATINGGATDLRSTGASAVLDASSLASWTHTGGDLSRWWVRDGGTTIVAPTGIALKGVNMLVDGGGKVQGGPVSLLTGSTLETAGGFNASLVNAAGSILPSAPIGLLPFGADFSQQIDGRLRVRFAGPGAGQFDTITVAGQAALGGRLDVQLQQNFAKMQLGDTIELLTAASRTGNFEFGGALLSSDTFLTPVGVGNKVLLLAALAGDANLDGKIDLNDFGLLKSNFGSGQRLSQGNMNGDGTIDLNDFGILKANFGRSDGPKLSELGAQAAPVPEPPTGALLALGMFALAWRRWRPRAPIQSSESITAYGLAACGKDCG
ncbi:MAG: PEP-CTERM sorting domain-containing protein [Pirellulales bacterium]